MEADWKDCAGIKGALGLGKPKGASAEVAKQPRYIETVYGVGYRLKRSAA